MLRLASNRGHKTRLSLFFSSPKGLWLNMLLFVYCSFIFPLRWQLRSNKKRLPLSSIPRIWVSQVPTPPRKKRYLFLFFVSCLCGLTLLLSTLPPARNASVECCRIFSFPYPPNLECWLLFCRIPPSPTWWLLFWAWQLPPPFFFDCV